MTTNSADIAMDDGLSPTTTSAPLAVEDQVHSPPPERPFQCAYCKARYTRNDHLSRHVRSHTDKRPFSCSVCAMSFTRTDLLVRHYAVHENGTPRRTRPSSGSIDAATVRVSKACRPCRQAKIKCQAQKPCDRCRARGLTCVTPFSPGRAIPQGDIDETNGVVGRTEPRRFSATETMSSTTESEAVREDEVVDTPPRQTLGPSLDHVDVQVLRPSTWNAPLDPIRPGQHASGPPANNLLADAAIDFSLIGDWCFTDSSDVPWVDRAMSIGFAAFNDTIWAAKRSREPGPVDTETRLDMLDDAARSLLGMKQFQVVKPLDAPARDSILMALAQWSSRPLKFRLDRFPSSQTLNMLMQNYFAQHVGSDDCWMNLHTFQPQDAPPELLSLLIAAGAISTSIPSLTRFGYMVYDVVQEHIFHNLANQRMPVTELQHLQSIALALDIGFWSGCTERIDLTNCLLAAALSRLRRSSRLSRSAYTAEDPSDEDEGEILEAMWRKWISDESYKRIIAHFCIFDAQTCTTLHTKPLTSFAEYGLPFPSPKEIWLARDALEWKTLYLARPSSVPTRVVNCLLNFPGMRIPTGFVDAHLATLVVLYSLSRMVFERNQMATAFNEVASEPTPEICSSSVSMKAELRVAIGTLTKDLEEHNNEDINTWLIMEHLALCVNVSTENLHVLSGRSGMEASRRIFPVMRQWVLHSDSRQALWHAGQILRFAKLAPQTLRGFHIIVVFHAALTLTTYALLVKSLTELTKAGKDDVSLLQDSSRTLWLDGQGTGGFDDFLQNGGYMVGIRGCERGPQPSSHALLNDAYQVAKVTGEIITTKCSLRDGEELMHSLPWVDSLVNLLLSLGSASTIISSPCSDAISPPQHTSSMVQVSEVHPVWN